MREPTPVYVIGKVKEEVLKKAGEKGLLHEEIVEGPFGRAGRSGEVYLVWGVNPSPVVERAVTWFVFHYHSPALALKPRFFYCCFAGTHASVAAAALHLKIAERGSDLAQIWCFDSLSMADAGVPQFLGEDKFGSEVYVLGTGCHSFTLEFALCDLAALGYPEGQTCVVSVRGFLDLHARIGGFLSRRMGLSAGRSMVISSLDSKLSDIKEAVRRCIDLSMRWADNENRLSGEVIWHDGRSGRWIDKRCGTGIRGRGDGAQAR